MLEHGGRVPGHLNLRVVGHLQPHLLRHQIHQATERGCNRRQRQPAMEEPVEPMHGFTL